MIYGPNNDDAMWRTTYINELYMLYNELDSVKVLKKGRLTWLGHYFRMQELDPCRKLLVLKPEATRCEVASVS